jgi:hypothetical protein
MKTRVDFFKPSGKWYTTEYLDITRIPAGSVAADEFRYTLRKHLSGRLSGMWAVVRESPEDSEAGDILESGLTVPFPLMVMVP